MSQKRQAALAYLALGYRIFPCQSNGKAPITAHGVKDATNDREKVDAMWTKDPSANIGLACGSGSGVIVVDIDVKSGNGYESIANAGLLPVTPNQRTPSGGEHYVFTFADGLPGNVANLLPSVDIRTEGGYILLAPSTIGAGRYEWKPGYSPWEVVSASYPEFLPKGKLSPPPLPVPANRNVSLSEQELWDMADRYFEPMPHATTGGDSEGKSGHERLLWAFNCCARGMRMGAEGASDYLLARWNPLCSPPWDLSQVKDRKEWEHKKRECSRASFGKPDGWILDDPEYADIRRPVYQFPEGFDMEAFITNSRAKAALMADEPEPDPFEPVPGPEPETVPKPHPPVPGIDHDGTGLWLSQKQFELEDKELNYLCQPHGMVGELAHYINQGAIRPQPYLSVAASLVFLGAIFGRRVQDDWGSRTNIYCLGVGPTSAGKANAIKAIRRIAYEAGADQYLGSDDVTSASAIETEVYEQPSLAYVWDEIGFFLKATKSRNEHKSGIIPMLMKLYSAADCIYKGKGYADAEKSRVIVEPCLSVYGTSTPVRLYEGIAEDELIDGWISRLLFFVTTDRPKKVGFKPSLKSAPRSLCERIAAWKGRYAPKLREGPRTYIGDHLAPIGAKGVEMPRPATYKTDKRAEKFFQDLDNEAESMHEYEALWLKAVENARRVALILAASRGGKKAIIAIDAEYGTRLARRSIIDFITTITPNVGMVQSDKWYAKILDKIRQSGEDGCSKGDIAKTLRVPMQDRNNLLKVMCGEKDIIAVSYCIPGRKEATRYWAIEYRKIAKACEEEAKQWAKK